MSDQHPDKSPDDGSSRTIESSKETADAIDALVAETADAVLDRKEFDVGALFEALSEPGRRYVLTYLLQSEGSVACSELVDYVVERTDTAMTDEEFRRRVVTELTHSHLPKLEAAGLVKYNMERQLVDPTDLTPVAGPYLQLALRHQNLAGTGED
jgi:DNA-binding transcriptional ArsR family regulator